MTSCALLHALVYLRHISVTFIRINFLIIIFVTFFDPFYTLTFFISIELSSLTRMQITLVI